METAGPYAEVERALAGSAFGRITYIARTTSTNADAAALLGLPEALGLTIVAESQSGGAGRKGRSWIAPPGSGLLLTTILPSSMAATDAWIVPFWVALALRDALQRHGIPTEVHWPNDLLLHGAKIAGILCTSRIIGEQAWIACGVGVNTHRFAEAGTAITPPPAFCDDVATVARDTLLREILLTFDARLSLLTTPQHLARRWEQAAGLPGRRYRVLRDGEEHPFEATALALATGGALIIERDGRREQIDLADARALR
ncbi:MAG: biotin--[acetyl-CoA-carboxylase] ligase [Vulcanimicrobiaceae bacterium]